MGCAYDVCGQTYFNFFCLSISSSSPKSSVTSDLSIMYLNQLISCVCIIYRHITKRMNCMVWRFVIHSWRATFTFPNLGKMSMQERSIINNSIQQLFPSIKILTQTTYINMPNCFKNCDVQAILSMYKPKLESKMSSFWFLILPPAILCRSMWQTLGILTGVCVFSEILYQFYAYRFRRRATKAEEYTEVLFFPDQKVACIKHFISECESESCSFSHEENSLGKLFRYLHQAQNSIDVCVFVITCKDLADILIQALERGVRVRVITDCEQVDIPGSQIWRLRSKGACISTSTLWLALWCYLGMIREHRSF